MTRSPFWACTLAPLLAACWGHSGHGGGGSSSWSHSSSSGSSSSGSSFHSASPAHASSNSVSSSSSFSSAPAPAHHWSGGSVRPVDATERGDRGRGGGGGEVVADALGAVFAGPGPAEEIEVAHPSTPPVDDMNGPAAWGSVATLQIQSGACRGPREQPLGKAVLYRNAWLTLLPLGLDGSPHALPASVRADLTGPAHFAASAGTTEGALALAPDPPLGAAVHVELNDDATGTRLSLEVSTREADAPCP